MLHWGWDTGTLTALTDTPTRTRLGEWLQSASRKVWSKEMASLLLQSYGIISSVVVFRIYKQEAIIGLQGGTPCLWGCASSLSEHFKGPPARLPRPLPLSLATLDSEERAGEWRGVDLRPWVGGKVLGGELYSPRLAWEKTKIPRWLPFVGHGGACEQGAGQGHWNL